MWQRIFGRALEKPSHHEKNLQSVKKNCMSPQNRSRGVKKSNEMKSMKAIVRIDNRIIHIKLHTVSLNYSQLGNSDTHQILYRQTTQSTCTVREFYLTNYDSRSTENRFKIRWTRKVEREACWHWTLRGA